MNSTGDLVVSPGGIEKIRKLPSKHRTVKTKQCQIQLLMKPPVAQVVKDKNVT